MTFIVKVSGVNGMRKTKGCEKAGNAILKFLNEIYSNEQGVSIDVKNLDLEEIHLDNSNVKLSNNLIYENSLEMFQEKPKIIFLGGDHSISFSTTKSFLDYCNKENKEPCLIIFDAHADLMKPINLEPMDREWLRKLIEVGFPTENILLVGVRNMQKEEIDFFKKNKIRMLSINRIGENLEDACDTIMEFSNGKDLYVSVDISVVDPVFASSVDYPEIGGLSSRELIYIIQRMNKIKNLRAIDIVGINPEKDENHKTVKLGAKILSELI